MLIVRLVLAANLIVYGIFTGAARPLSVAALLFAALIAVGAVFSYYRLTKHDENRSR